MNEKEVLTEKIRAAKFSCRLCGACCSGADNEVMVTPDEVAHILQQEARIRGIYPF